MNRRQRIADSDMAYLGRAWRAGFIGPSPTPSTNDYIADHAKLWQKIYQDMRTLPRMFDEERVWEIHARWLRLLHADEYSAVVLRMHYRDRDEFDNGVLKRALDRFSRA